jgi:hypothetical protein
MISFTFPIRMVDVDQLNEELGDLGVASADDGRVTVTFDRSEVEEQIEAIVRAHRPQAFDEFDRLVTKARAVWSGEDTFTQAQAQKILAGLVLVVARYLR